MEEISIRRWSISVLIVACLLTASVAVWATMSLRRSAYSAGAAIGAVDRYGQQGLRVSGTAVVRTAPELATVVLGHESWNRSAKVARENNDRTMQKVISAIQSQGIARKDIQTVEYRVYPVWKNKPVWRNEPVLTGSKPVLLWHVLNMVEVRVRDVNRVTDVIDAAMAAGADQLRGVDFSVESLHRLRSRAREKAVEVARAKAEQLARLTNARIGRVVSVVDNSYQYYGGANANIQLTVQDAPDALADEGTGQISKGQVAVQARVDVVFALE